MDGFLIAGLEDFDRFPAKFAFNFEGVDGVTAVVSGMVFDIGDLVFARPAVDAPEKLLKHATNGMDNVEVGSFGPATDVIDLAYPSGGGHDYEWISLAKKSA